MKNVKHQNILYIFVDNLLPKEATAIIVHT